MSLAIDNVDVVEVEEDVVLAKTTRAKHTVHGLSNPVKFNVCQYLFYERTATPSELTSCCEGVHPNVHLQTLMSCGVVEFGYLSGGVKSYRLTPYGNAVMSAILEHGVEAFMLAPSPATITSETTITGAVIREYRSSKNMTQKDLAAQLGYHPLSLCNVEKKPHKAVSTRLANRFRDLLSTQNNINYSSDD